MNQHLEVCFTTFVKNTKRGKRSTYFQFSGILSQQKHSVLTALCLDRNVVQPIHNVASTLDSKFKENYAMNVVSTTLLQR